MSDQNDLDLNAEQLSVILGEVERVFGHLPSTERGSGLDVALAIGSVDDALTFFRTLPSGIAWEELPAYAAAFEQRLRATQ